MLLCDLVEYSHFFGNRHVAQAFTVLYRVNLPERR